MLQNTVIFAALATAGHANVAIPTVSRQVVLVTSQGWNTSEANVRIFSRTKRGWEQTGAPMAALTGRNGMAWGLGLHGKEIGAPRKKEGDGRAPAGVFSFGPAFSREAVRLGVKCITITASHEAIDDPKSRYYNQLVDLRTVADPDWNTSEKLFGSAHYTLGIWVNHNSRRIPGAGSCIYLHEWVGERTGTAGCTVLRIADLKRTLGTLKASAQPVLVQLPETIARERLPELFRKSSAVQHDSATTP